MRDPQWCGSARASVQPLVRDSRSCQIPISHTLSARPLVRDSYLARFVRRIPILRGCGMGFPLDWGRERILAPARTPHLIQPDDDVSHSAGQRKERQHDDRPLPARAFCYLKSVF